MGDLVRVESLGAVAARQSIVVEPLRSLIAEHGEEALVRTVTSCAPFGNYLTGVELYTGPVRCAESDHGSRPHERTASCIWPAAAELEVAS